METLSLFLFVTAIIAIIVGIFFLTRKLDENRIRAYLRRRGAELLSLDQAIMGHGWTGDSDESIYNIRYRDKEQNVHRAFAKTSMGSGVYLTEDVIIGSEARTAAINAGLRKDWLEKSETRTPD